MEVFHVHWRSYNEEYRHTIGFLIYDKKWFFKYNQVSIQQAIKQGFRPFPSMEDIAKVYKSDSLFLPFLSRYPHKENHEMISFMKNASGELLTDKILIKYLKKREYDE